MSSGHSSTWTLGASAPVLYDCLTCWKTIEAPMAITGFCSCLLNPTIDWKTFATWRVVDFAGHSWYHGSQKEVSGLLLQSYLEFISLGISQYRCSGPPWIPVFTVLLPSWIHGPLLIHWLQTGRTQRTAKSSNWKSKHTHTHTHPWPHVRTHNTKHVHAHISNRRRTLKYMQALFQSHTHTHTDACVSNVGYKSHFSRLQ